MKRLAYFEHMRVSWLQCLRTNAVVGVVVAGAIVLGIAWLFASFSMRQPLVVAVDLGFSGVRILAAFLMLLWIQEVFVRDIERSLVLGNFAFPVTRSCYVLGRFSGVALLSLVAVSLWGIGLLLLGTYADGGYAASSKPLLGGALCLSLAGLWIDTLVIGAFMLLVVSLATTRFLPLFVGFAFTLAARGLGPVLDYLRFSADADPDLKLRVLPILETIRWVLPDLSRLDWRDAMLLGNWPDLPLVTHAVAGGAGALLICLTAALVIYGKREFV